jgi:hypothetical protein
MNRIGTVPGFNTHPKGLRPNEELARALATVYSGKYVNPGYTAEDNRKAFSRYDAVTGVYNDVAFYQAKSWVQFMFKDFMRTEFATHEQVIQNMDLSTSVGYPYSLDFSTKRELFEAYGTNWLQLGFDYWLQKPYRGLYKNFMKEEMREKGKDTRGILAGPVDLNYYMSRLFLAQNEGFYSSYLLTPSAVGISRDGLEWNMLFKKLSKYSFGSDMDVKKFDSRMLRVIMEAVRDIRKSYLFTHQEWAKPAMDEAYEILIDTLCIIEGEVWQKSGGNPTGSVNTVVDNTLALCIIMCYAYITLNPGKATLKDFLGLVRAAMYGDDFTSTHSPDVVFDPESISRVLKTAFGYDCTHDGEKPVTELSFLSANFDFVQLANERLAVPLFDRDKMSSHIIFGYRKDPHVEFQRVASLRAINCWDDYLVSICDEWLLRHRSDVSGVEFEQWVPSIEVIRARYLIPKKREPVFDIYSEGIEAQGVITLEKDLMYTPQENGIHLYKMPRKRNRNGKNKANASGQQVALANAERAVSKAAGNVSKLATTLGSLNIGGRALGYGKYARGGGPVGPPSIPSIPRTPKGARSSYTEARMLALEMDDPQVAFLMRRGFSESGANWFLQAVNPFPDAKRKAIGYPDINSGLSLPRKVKQEIIINSPAGLADGATWDLHVCFLPDLVSKQYTVYDKILVDNTSQQSVVQPLEGILGRTPIMIHKVLSGQPTYPTTLGAFNPTNFEAQYLDFGRELEGNIRMVGGGFELIPATSAFNDQGTLTSYRFDQHPTKTTGIDFAQGMLPDYNPVSILHTSMRLPPATAAQAVKINNSVEWTARNGAYVTLTQSEMHNPPNQFVNCVPMYKANDIELLDGSATVGVGTTWIADLATGTTQAGPQCITVPWNTSGVYGTGFAKGASMKLVVTIYVEEFIAPNDADLSLAVDSPPYDCVALDYYQKVVNKVPPAVYLAANYRGEWVENLLRFVGKIATPIGAALNSFLPGSGMVGAAIATGSNKLADYTRDKYDIPQGA